MKKIITIVVLASAIFLLAGCEKKENSKKSLIPHSEKEVKEIIDNNKDYYIVETNKADKEVYSAMINDFDGRYFKFFVLKDNESALNFFKYYTNVFKSYKIDSDTENVVENKSYELIKSDKYYYVKLDNNSIVVVDCKLEDRDATMEMVKFIKY